MKKNSKEFKKHLKKIGFKKGKDKRRHPGVRFKKGHKGYFKDKKFSKDHKIKLGKSVSKATKGRKPWNKGKGTKCAKNLLIRTSKKYKEFRLEIFIRDNWTCQNCKKTGGYLEMHHIKEFANYPKLRFKKSNAITLCKDCHRKTDNYGSRVKNKPKEK